LHCQHRKAARGQRGLCGKCYATVSVREQYVDQRTKPLRLTDGQRDLIAGFFPEIVKYVTKVLRRLQVPESDHGDLVGDAMMNACRRGTRLGNNDKNPKAFLFKAAIFGVQQSMGRRRSKESLHSKWVAYQEYKLC